MCGHRTERHTTGCGDWIVIKGDAEGYPSDKNDEWSLFETLREKVEIVLSIQ